MKHAPRSSWPILFLCALLFALAINLWSFVQNSYSTATDPGATTQSYAEFAKVPESDRIRRNPMEGDPTAMAAGRKLFEQHCAVCHGKTAEGARKGPSLRAGGAGRNTRNAVLDPD